MNAKLKLTAVAAAALLIMTQAYANPGTPDALAAATPDQVATPAAAPESPAAAQAATPGAAPESPAAAQAAAAAAIASATADMNAAGLTQDQISATLAAAQALNSQLGELGTITAAMIADGLPLATEAAPNV